MTDRTDDPVYTGSVRIRPRSSSAAKETSAREPASPTQVGGFESSSHQYLHRFLRTIHSASASQPQSDDPLWRTYIRRRLNEMAAHPAQDGYPRGDTLVSAARWADQLVPLRSPTPSVVPGNEGEVDLVWHRDGWDLELSIGPTSVYLWAFNSNTAEEFSGDLDYENRDLLKELLSDWATKVHQ